jgi:hypothetical protein
MSFLNKFLSPVPFWPVQFPALIHWCIQRVLKDELITFWWSNAFDTVSHCLLVCKLRSVWLSSNCVNWCHSFLTNRRVRQIQRIVSQKNYFIVDHATCFGLNKGCHQALVHIYRKKSFNQQPVKHRPNWYLSFTCQQFIYSISRSCDMFMSNFTLKIIY